MSYGVRYLSVRRFISYCKELNVAVDELELEHYEKTAVMLPAARIVYPAEYMQHIYEWEKNPSSNRTSSANKWSEIEKLFDRPFLLPRDYAQLSDNELIDSFDRDFGKNSFLIRPTPNDYQKWDDYRVVVDHYQDDPITRSNVEHYYAYWQVHQLYEIRKSPDLYENRVLIENLSDEFKAKLGDFYPRAFNKNIYLTFRGNAHYFDALSFYITMYHREQERIFAPIPEQHQVKSLDDQQLQEYRKRLSNHAKFVFDKYSFKENEPYIFLVALLKFQQEYERDERLKLSNEIKQDIIYQAQFINGLTGKEWDQVAEEITNRKLGDYWTKRRFRHIDLSIKEYDNARKSLSYYAKRYNDDLVKINIQNPVCPFQEKEIDEVLQFFRNEGLMILAFSLDEMIATQDETRKFRRVVRYTNIKNILTSFEYFLKTISPSSMVASLGTPTLTPLIQRCMKQEAGWKSLFDSNLNFTKGKSSSDFYVSLITILTDPRFNQSENQFWARNFLITCLARNLTVHLYPTDDWFYGNLFGDIMSAVIYVFFYSWYVAKREKWV